jgi:hypothetical protein
VWTVLRDDLGLGVPAATQVLRRTVTALLDTAAGPVTRQR